MRATVRQLWLRLKAHQAATRHERDVFERASGGELPYNPFLQLVAILERFGGRAGWRRRS